MPTSFYYLFNHNTQHNTTKCLSMMQRYSALCRTSTRHQMLWAESLTPLPITSFLMHVDEEKRLKAPRIFLRKKRKKTRETDVSCQLSVFWRHLVFQFPSKSQGPQETISWSVSFLLVEILTVCRSRSVGLRCVSRSRSLLWISCFSLSSVRSCRRSAAAVSPQRRREKRNTMAGSSLDDSRWLTRPVQCSLFGVATLRRRASAACPPPPLSPVLVRLRCRCGRLAGRSRPRLDWYSVRYRLRGLVAAAAAAAFGGTSATDRLLSSLLWRRPRTESRASWWL